MAQFFYDFSTFSNGDIATVAAGVWAKQQSDTHWTYTVATDAGATGGKTFIVQDDNLDWGDLASCIVNDAAGASTGDFEIYARMKIATLSNLDGGRPAGPALISSGNAAYAFRYNGDAVLSYFTGGSAQANIGSAITITLVDNTYFKVRIGRVGTTVRMKVWLDGDAEPGSWQATGTHSTLTTVKAGIHTFDYNAGPYTFDVIGIGTGADVAPTSGGGGGPVETVKTMTDTVTAGDATFRYLMRRRDGSEVFSVNDALVSGVRRGVTATENVSVNDAFLRYLRFMRRTDDDLSIIDSIVQQLSGSGLIVTKVMSETVVMTDGTIRVLNWVRAQTDTVTITEGETFRTIIITANEELSITDDTVKILRFRRIAQDAIELIDVFSKSVGSAGGILYARVMSDSVTLIDSAGERWTLRTSRLTDTVAPSDAALRALARVRIQGDVIELSDGNVSIRRTVRFADDPIDVPDELIRTLILDQVYNVEIRMGHFDPIRFGGQ
jgi:hypothetical protein